MKLITTVIAEMTADLDDAGQTLLEHAALAVGLATAGKDPIKITGAVKVLLKCMIAYNLVNPLNVPKEPDDFDKFIASLSDDADTAPGGTG